MKEKSVTIDIGNTTFFTNIQGVKFNICFIRYKRIMSTPKYTKINAKYAASAGSPKEKANHVNGKTKHPMVVRIRTYLFILPVTIHATYPVFHNIDTIDPIIIKKKKTTVLSGTIFNQSRKIYSVSRYKGRVNKSTK